MNENENASANTLESYGHEECGIHLRKGYYYKITVLGFLVFFLFISAIFLFRTLDVSGTAHQALPQGAVSKFDFKNDLPDSFFKALPLVKNSKVVESYRIKYADRTELTVVVVSDKTAKDFFFSQIGFLKRKNWVIDKTLINKDMLTLHAIYMNDRLDVSVSNSTSTNLTAKITLTNY